MSGIKSPNLLSEGWKVFEQFKHVAEDANVSGRTVLRMGEGEGREITTGGDFIGNVGRFQKTQDRNNEVRTTFLKAVLDMYGGSLDKVPDEVKVALELHNFAADANGTATTGRPLSVRRVRAVMAAVAAAGGEAVAAAGVKALTVEQRIQGLKSGFMRMIWDPLLKPNYDAQAINGMIDGLADDIETCLTEAVKGNGPASGTTAKDALRKTMCRLLEIPCEQISTQMPFSDQGNNLKKGVVRCLFALAKARARVRQQVLLEENVKPFEVPARLEDDRLGLIANAFAPRLSELDIHAADMNIDGLLDDLQVMTEQVAT